MDLPKLHLKLKPYWEWGEVKYMDVNYEVEGLNLKKDEELANIFKVVASIPCCRFSEEGITAFDDKGYLPLEQKDEEGPYGPVRKWYVKRDTKGIIRFNYRVYPRELPENYASSPYFDLRTEEGGINGAGVTFLVQIKEQEYRIKLEWDLDDMPKGSIGVWSKGEGTVETVGTSHMVVFSYYEAGLVKKIEYEEYKNFAFYWLGHTNFDVEAIAERVKSLYAYFTEFFRDKDCPFKVFMRHDPFEESGGGTALVDSFMFGYSDKMLPTPDGTQELLAHEMVHNWISLEGTLEETTWYVEGAAEYYSTVLPYRAGLCSLDDVAKVITEKANKYYANIYRNITNREAMEMSWKDRRTQVIPYGRGFCFLAKVDSEIRKASNGKRSLDDVVLELIRINREEYVKDKHPGVEDFIRLVNKELGRDIRPEYEDMASGKLIEPSEEWFGNAFKIREVEMEAYKIKGDKTKGARVTGYEWVVKEGIDRESVVL